ncbi:unnamed protein product [Protopolystoma xenopodis]|uniref:Uncharacterized protein n=1 Tax=Protopolystoma xenopodis TaxID=117903 RepID=A0A3S5ANK3_9PLAT|nr:unnamed protein product [Protopolystoma xenopodis]
MSTAFLVVCIIVSSLCDVFRGLASFGLHFAADPLNMLASYAEFAFCFTNIFPFAWYSQLGSNPLCPPSRVLSAIM